MRDPLKDLPLRRAFLRSDSEPRLASGFNHIARPSWSPHPGGVSVYNTQLHRGKYIKLPCSFSRTRTLRKFRSCRQCSAQGSQGQTSTCVIDDVCVLRRRLHQNKTMSGTKHVISFQGDNFFSSYIPVGWLMASQASEPAISPCALHARITIPHGDCRMMRRVRPVCNVELIVSESLYEYHFLA